MITIYKRDFCPYCRKVMEFAQENNYEVEWKDIGKNPEHKQELMDVGGKTQVPFLLDAEKGVEMYESDAIIEYLQAKA